MSRCNLPILTASNKLWVRIGKPTPKLPGLNHRLLVPFCRTIWTKMGNEIMKQKKGAADQADGKGLCSISARKMSPIYYIIAMDAILLSKHTSIKSTSIKSTSETDLSYR